MILLGVATPDNMRSHVKILKILKNSLKNICARLEYWERAPSNVGPLVRGADPHDATASFFLSRSLCASAMPGLALIAIRREHSTSTGATCQSRLEDGVPWSHHKMC